jgi:alpha-L-fucosidase
MEAHGEAIHGTLASPFPRRLPWGRVTRRPQGSGEVLYLHLWENPSDGVLRLPQLDAEPARAQFLGSSSPVSVKKSPEALEIRFREPSPEELLPVVKLEFAQPVRLPEASLPSPGPDGKIRLAVWDADCLGHYDGNIQTVGKGEEAYLGNWKNPKYSVEYQVSNSVAATWRVRAEISAERETFLDLRTGKEKTPAKVSATLGGWAWQDLGAVRLPAGAGTVGLQPTTHGWSEIRLRRVELTPAP